MLLPMLFMFFFFLGFAAMFYYLLRRLDSHCQLLSDENAQLRVLLRALESRLEQLAHGAPVEQPTPSGAMADEWDAAAETGGAGKDPLLHLSFEEPPHLERPENGDFRLDLNLDPQNPHPGQNQR